MLLFIQQLVDDALNLARGNKLQYATAFEVVLTMQLETAYAPWKAFVRNMNFLRKRLVAMVTEDEDLDPDIYLVIYLINYDINHYCWASFLLTYVRYVLMHHGSVPDLGSLPPTASVV